MAHCPKCRAQTVVDPPIRTFEDYFHPRPVQVIQPVEIIRRHHCVPVPYHTVTYTVKDEFCG